MSQSNATRHAMSDAIRQAYHEGQEDETLEPMVLVDNAGHPVGRIQDGDYVIFYDIRGEREVELTASLTEPDFDAFHKEPAVLAHFVTMIQYDAALPVQVAFPPPGEIRDTLAEVISAQGMAQAKVSESEKAIHVSFFFNGKKRDPLPGEQRVIVPSPRDVDNYALVPALSASDVTAATLELLQQGTCRFVVTNYANVDVVGHIEDESAVRRAVETVDHEIGELVRGARQAGYTVLVTADHGTVESWLYPDGAVDTGHTDSLVPFVLVPTQDGLEIGLRDGGALTDVAPTVLQLLGLPVPAAMTGSALIEKAPVNWLNKAKERKVLLIIADGWGWRPETHGNLIASSDTPNMDRLERTYPFTALEAAGEAVGMPATSVGNSESGHLHLGTGRRIISDRLRIDTALADGSYYENEAFLWAMRQAKAEGKRLHLLGIVSFYSSHGSVDHLLALLKLAQREAVPEVYIHGMLGRRGEQPESGPNYIALVEDETAKLGIGQVVSVIGRFWSLDREENWDRIAKTYDQLVGGQGIPVRA